MGRVSAENAINNKLELLSIGFYLELVRIVFSSSLVQLEHLAGTGSYQNLLSWLIAIPVLCFYVHHFFSVIFKKQRQTSVDFFVTFVLVYATFSVAAIVVGRVPLFGVEYLNQPRYVLVYQLIPFALAMKYCFSLGNKKIYIIARNIAVLIMLPAMLCAQFHFSGSAYAAVPWMSKWVYEQTKTIDDYVNEPNLPAGNCTNFSSTICNFSAFERNKLLGLLMNNQLNIFNYDFQWRHKIFLPMQIEAPSVSAWGPPVIGAQSSDGIWIKLSRPIVSADAKVQVRIDGKSIGMIIFARDVITFLLPDEYKSVPGLHMIEYSVDDWASSVLVGHIEVRN
jgi:hypothetical protein